MSLLVSGTLLALSLLQKPDVFLAQGPYSAGVQTPQEILGYGPGERVTTYFDQQRYLEAVQRSAPDRVKLIQYGMSTQGRPLRVLVIGNPDKIEQLESTRQSNLKLAQGIGSDNDKKIPSIVWINETIHGDEAASFESGMWLIYNLVAGQSEDLKKARENSLIIVNPCYNADGHERFAVWYNSVANGTNDPGAFEYTEPNIVDGRTNHFRFDLNRDRVAMSQKESQAEAAEFRRWMPHVYVDQHGEVSTYFFPPAAMAMNKNIDRKRYNRWTEVFGMDTAKAFDAKGYSYYIRDIFDLYYPGYMDSFTTLNGSIGMTHETDGQLLQQSNPDGSERSLRLGMAKHFTSALAVIQSASNNRTELVSSFADFRKQNLSGEAFGSKRNYSMLSDTQHEAKRLQTQLDHLGIAYSATYGLGEVDSAESLWENEASKVSRRGYWTTVDLAQPNGALAKALLEPESDFEPEFTAEQLRRKKEGQWGEFYDMTAWSLPFLHSLPAWRSEQPMKLTAMIPSMSRVPSRSTVGYALLPGLDGARKALSLHDKGYKLQMTPEEIKIGSLTLPKGTLFVLAQPNPGLADSKIEDFTDCISLPSAYPSQGKHSPGSEGMISLKSPKIALLCGTMESPTQFAPVQFVLTQMLGLNVANLSNRGLDNLSKYTVLVAPAGANLDATKLRPWVSAGGCLIVLEGGSNMIELPEGKTLSSAIPGALFKANLNPDSWICYGLPKEIAVPVDGMTVIGADDSTAVSVVSSGKTHLSGWIWPDESENSAKGSAFCHVQSVGKGNVVWFAQDPTNRSMYPGLWGLLMNAVVMGARY